MISDDFLPPVIEWERKARMTIVKEQASKLDDQTFRSLGLLRSARMLSSEEAMKCLGNLRLGVCLDRVEDIAMSTINQLIIEIHPAHIRRKFGNDLSDDEIDRYRSDFIREKLEK